VEGSSDKELAELRPWMGNESLADMIRSETFEHEAEHLPQLLKWKRKVGE